MVARARVRCASAKFKKLSPILTTRGASYHIKGKIYRALSRVYWHMGLKPGRWKLKICIVWKGQSGWWWSGCLECRWRMESEVWICTVSWLYQVWQMWWGVADWSGLGIWSVGVWMIGCQPVEVWRWHGWGVGIRTGRVGVWEMEMWPSGIGSHLGRNRLWVRFLAVSDIYPMFTEPTITWVSSGFSGYIWLDTKIVLKKGHFQNKWWLWWWWWWSLCIMTL